MYGLALEGQAGVEAVIKNLLTDFSLTLGLSGYRSVDEVRQHLAANLQKI
jgi:isopentenyl diphosphate isomerase/L-lactate dehydrogenase-like FMN-dependent dehydrogenase